MMKIWMLLEIFCLYILIFPIQLILVSPCVVLADGTISSASVTSAGVVTLTAATNGKLIDGTLDIECNY